MGATATALASRRPSGSPVADPPPRRDTAPATTSPSTAAAAEPTATSLAHEDRPARLLPRDAPRPGVPRRVGFPPDFTL
ncbi:hypothetical protein Misp01_28330 [Microtetraspora sp. NBRC 13810]|nr:hypothetical protein Misp01_28330 [Microtetraspora sp. NBRC 13810]